MHCFSLSLSLFFFFDFPSYLSAIISRFIIILPKYGLWFRERGSCFHEWFRVKSNGVKQRLSTDGEF